jgi:hypothetical protein
MAASTAALVLTSAAGAAVHLVRLTSPVQPRSEATLTARVIPHTVRCSITVTYKSGPSHAAGLSPKRPSRTGRVTWTWEVGPSTTPGRWPIVVSCARAGTLRAFIRVGGKGSGSKPPPRKLALGQTVLLGRRTRTRGCRRGELPDRRCSPGAYYSKLTRAVICSPSFHTGAIRDVPQSEKFAVEREYGKAAIYYGRSVEIDHIVPLELGGSNSIANLYFEPGSGRASYHAKDRLENKLNDMVCSGSITLRKAQKQIASNWKTLYRGVFGRAP